MCIRDSVRPEFAASERNISRPWHQSPSLHYFIYETYIDAVLLRMTDKELFIIIMRIFIYIILSMRHIDAVCLINKYALNLCEYSFTCLIYVEYRYSFTSYNWLKNIYWNYANINLHYFNLVFMQQLRINQCMHVQSAPWRR